MEPASNRTLANCSTRPRRGVPGTSRRTAYEWVSQIGDPAAALRALGSFPGFIRDLRRYRRLTDRKVRWRDTIPRLSDATGSTPFDPQYFYMTAWTAKQIVDGGASFHVDVGGPVSLAACLAAMVPTAFVDYRPLEAQLPWLFSVAGDLLHLPLKDGSVDSLSCLHVAEHVGLGRYGDPLDPEGTRKACVELQRVLAPDGTLLFAAPVSDRETHHFNAHRVHRVEDVIGMFPELKVAELTLVDDDGALRTNITPEQVPPLTYGCGLFRLERAG